MGILRHWQLLRLPEFCFPAIIRHAASTMLRAATVAGFLFGLCGTSLAQPWPGHVLCTLVIGNPGSQAGYSYFGTQRWDINQGPAQCIGAPANTANCYGYVWTFNGLGANPDPNPHYAETWTNQGMKNSDPGQGFEQKPVGATIHVQQVAAKLEADEVILKGDHMGTMCGDYGVTCGQRGEWPILRDTANEPDVTFAPGTSVSGGFILKVSNPVYQSGPTFRDINCLYAFGADPAAQQSVSAVRTGGTSFDVFGIDPWDSTIIRRKSFVGIWGPGSTMAEDWGLTGTTSTAPAAGFLNSPPAAVAISSTEIHVFAVASDGSAYHTKLGGSCVPTCSPAAWESIGRPSTGGFINSIAAVSTGSNKFELFALGSDGKAYRKSYASGTWSPSISANWQSIGGKGGGALVGSPAITSWGADRFDVFATGDDGKVYHKFFEGAWLASGAGSQTGDWELVGALPAGVKILGSLSVVSWGAGRLDVFANGNDGKVYHKYTEGGWGPGSITADWESIGGPPAGSAIFGPAAAAWGSYRLDIFVTGKDGNIYHKYYGGGWGPGSIAADWESVGGSGQSGIQALTGPPTVVSWGTDRLDIFATNGARKAYHKFWGGHDWRPGNRTADWELISN